MPVEMNEFFGSMINMDDPRHFRLRSIVSRGFTPKEIARVEEYVKTKAAAVVDRLLEEFPDVTISKIRFLESQGLIEPERTPSGYRKFTDAEIEQGRDTLRDEMVNARRDRFFGAYMEKAKKNLKITTRDDVLARVIGS